MRTKRIDLIERYIEEEKLVSLDVLCEKFAVSKNTIRRDIEELVKKGVVEKVYGGVSFKAPPSDTPLVPYEKRHTVLNTEKDNRHSEKSGCLFFCCHATEGFHISKSFVIHV